MVIANGNDPESLINPGYLTEMLGDGPPAKTSIDHRGQTAEFDIEHRLAQAASAAGRMATLLEPADLDHLLKRATKEGLGGMMAYADRRRRIPKKLIRQIADRL